MINNKHQTTNTKRQPHIQIVDTNDSPLTAATMDDAHREGLLHRLVRIIVEDEQGRLLLQKRSNRVKTYPACWDTSAAGHVDVGETYIQAAERELTEEIGLKSHNLHPLGYYTTNDNFGWRQLNRFNKAYKTVVPSHTEFYPHPDEVSEVKWFTQQDVKQLIIDQPDQISDGLIDLFDRYYR